MSVIEIGMKTLYSSEGREASEWVKTYTERGVVDLPQQSSGLSISKDGSCRVPLSHICYMNNKGNCMMYNDQEVYITSSACSRNSGFSLSAGEGWRRAISLFSARKLSKHTWINDREEYLVPSVYEGGLDK